MIGVGIHLMMKTFIRILSRKPTIYLFTTVSYLLLTTILKWPSFNQNILWYVFGGLLGVYFLDIAETFFHLSPSPFRTVLFLGAFLLVSMFIITSSGSYIAKGLVLSLYVQLLLLQFGEWRMMKSLSGWYKMISPPVPVRYQLVGLYVYTILFFIETFVFVR